MTTRRGFLQAAGAAGSALALGRADGAPSPDRRPNILFCIADDWGWPHAGVYGDRVVRTPTFDRLAREGAVCHHAYVAAPSCSPSRASILTGRMFWELEEGAVLWSFLPQRFAVYPDLLEQAGYAIGLQGKGWGPGDFKAGGRERNPAGPSFKDLASFLETLPAGQPFCFWFGDHNPHRPYNPGSGARSGLDPAAVQLPPWLPDVPEVRHDVLDYYAEVEQFDTNVGRMLDLLEAKGLLENTLVVVTGDNGWPFPRAKAYLYDRGVHVPLAIRWPGHVRPGRRIDDFISLADLAPTFLDVAGLQPPAEMTARSFVNVLRAEGSGSSDETRRQVVVGLERHGAPFPMRSLRTHEYSYIRYHTPGRYVCTDPGPTLSYLQAHRTAHERQAELCFGAHPAEELYDLTRDPDELRNVATEPAYAEVRERLAAALEAELRRTRDPRALGLSVEKMEQAPRFNPPR